MEASLLIENFQVPFFVFQDLASCKKTKNLFHMKDLYTRLNVVTETKDNFEMS